MACPSAGYADAHCFPAVGAKSHSGWTVQRHGVSSCSCCRSSSVSFQVSCVTQQDATVSCEQALYRGGSSSSMSLVEKCLLLTTTFHACRILWASHDWSSCNACQKCTWPHDAVDIMEWRCTVTTACSAFCGLSCSYAYVACLSLSGGTISTCRSCREASWTISPRPCLS